MLQATPMQKKLIPILWTVVAYTILVIIWGAWVRISHSGDGCGDTWPLCQGEFIPAASAAKKTWIEHFHRVMSGLFGIVIIAGYFYIRRTFSQGHPIRWAALASLILTITEALLGAKLVLSGLVGTNASMMRSLIMGLHFLNSALLVASVTLTALFSQHLQWRRRSIKQIIQTRVLNRLPIVALALFIFLGATGTIAALSTTLFPSTSLLEGFTKDFSDQSHMLLRLRALHPTMGIFAGVALAIMFLLVGETTDKSEHRVRRLSHLVAGVTSAAIVVGTVTLLWLSPLPLRLTHLALAHAIVISFTAWWQSLIYKA